MIPFHSPRLESDGQATGRRDEEGKQTVTLLRRNGRLKGMKRFSAPALWLFAVLPLLAPPGAARTLLVPQQYQAIQAAIDAGQAGDQVVVSPGTYRERLALKPGLILRSAGGDERSERGLKRAEETIIDGGGALSGEAEAMPGVTMAEGSILDGFTVTSVGLFDEERWQHHHATQGEEQDHEEIGGFGVPAIGADGVTCVIRHNIVHHNGHTGIAIRGATEKAILPVVRSNWSYRNMGSGIAIHSGWTVEIAGNELSREGGLPPMIMVFEGAEAVIRNNAITGNGVAGVRVGGKVNLIKNTFEGGKVRKGGPPHFGVWALPGAEVTMLHNRFNSWRHALFASGARVMAVANEARHFPKTGFVVENPARPALVVDNVAWGKAPDHAAVRIEGDQSGVRNNLLQAD